jgi:hypothetical protein
MRLLAREQDWSAVAEAATEALPLVSRRRPLRARIAGQLAEAGRKTGRPDWVLDGYRELFFSGPSDARLLRLSEEASRQGARDRELEGALRFITADHSDLRSLRVKLLLILGRMDEAFEIASGAPSIGWSYSENAAGVLFASVLALLCRDQIDGAPTVQRSLRRQADTQWGAYPLEEESEEGHEDPSAPGPQTTVSVEILRALRSVQVSPQREELLMQWAVRLGGDRVEQIVANLHRGAYARAAETLGALAECLLLRGEPDKGLDIVAEYRNRRFSRHRAFRQELDGVIGSSELLRRKLRSALGLR